MSMAAPKRTTTVKRSLALDDLYNQQDQQAAYEFYERFSDLQANQPQVDLYHTRQFKGTSQQLERISLARREFDLDKLGQLIRSQPTLRGKLYQVNESSSMNTYFLPLNTDDLDTLLEQPSDRLLATLEAHVIPNQVLFTRAMGFGSPQTSSLDGQQRVSLSLAKTMPLESSLREPSDLPAELESRKYLASPLLLQASCYPSSSSSSSSFRAGITSAEIVLANIPLSNGVLHLIRKPVLLTEATSVLDYLNDNDNQLSNVVNALGTRTSGSESANKSATPQKLDRFRELLARERQLLASISSDSTPNRTILAPSDEAFARLRYDIRALIQADDSLIPKHWDASYKQDLLERLVKRHVITQQAPITSDQIAKSASYGVPAISDNGKLLTFTAGDNGASLQVECDQQRARLLHHDLVGSNGVVHIIDRVLGEEQETVHSLLQSIVLKFNHSLTDSSSSSNSQDADPASKLNQLIQSSIRQQQPETMISAPASNSIGEEQSPVPMSQHRNRQELRAISEATAQYLTELATSNRRQLQLLASSVNISYQLARLTSLAEGLDDWNNKFKLQDRMFTYFVPSDLAWIRLQVSQPELHKPLMHFLELEQQQSSSSTEESGNNNSIYQPDQQSSARSGQRSSESSHRLRQILERHLVVNRKLTKKELNQLDSVQTVGATLRLVESPQSQQLTANFEGSPTSSQTGYESAFAALHSIQANPQAAPQHNSNSNQQIKSLKLDSIGANIVQVNEASNGFVYVIDNVLLLPEDAEYIVQTSSTPATSSTMSSLLGAHNSAILDFIQGLFSSSASSSGLSYISTHSMLAIMGTLTLMIAILLVLALVLVVRRRRLNKLNRHQQLESGLTSSSSANSGSTSTTKSL